MHSCSKILLKVPPTHNKKNPKSLFISLSHLRKNKSSQLQILLEAPRLKYCVSLLCLSLVNKLIEKNRKRKCQNAKINLEQWIEKIKELKVAESTNIYTFKFIKKNKKVIKYGIFSNIHSRDL